MRPTLESILSTPIPRIDCPTPEQFQRDYARQNKPVVITGSTDHAGAIQRWSPEYLASQCGDTRIPVFHYPKAFYRPDHGEARTIEMMTMGEFLERSKQTPPFLFLGNVPLGLFPSLQGDYALPRIFGRPPLIAVAFINWGGSITPLHFDLAEGLVVQLRGAKRVVLFPPGTRKLYPFRMFSNIAHFSQVDIDHPDLARFPRFDPAEAWEATLQPGEILYIPYCWWHQLHPLGDLNITNGYFWFSGLSKALRHFGQSFRRAMMLTSDVEYRIARERYRHVEPR